jgi:hypothetical protein
MAYAQAKSCNDALYLGAIEGGERQARPNRGGVVTSPPNDGWYASPMRDTVRGREAC